MAERPLYGESARPGRLFLRDLLRFMHHAREIERGGCWFWDNCNEDGYGRFVIGEVYHWAHRVAYQHFVGPIPEGHQIDHLCRNRACVNPDHLEAVTPEENNRRSESPSARCARLLHCKKGHPFDEANTCLRMRNGGVRRVCRACDAEKSRKRRARQKAEREGGGA